MSKTTAKFSLADISRVLRGAREQGAEVVEILPDGTIRVIISGTQHHKDEAKPEAKTIRDFKL